LNWRKKPEKTTDLRQTLSNNIWIFILKVTVHFCFWFFFVFFCLWCS
jgi:hypothetical protein